MAVSSSSYFNLAIQGVPQVGGGVDLYSSDSTAKFALGTKYERGDGSVFRYSHFGAAVNAGLLVAQDYSESSTAEMLNSMIPPDLAAAVPNESISAGKVGSRYVQASIDAATANQFAGGYLALTSETGAGFIYPIIGNTAEGDPATSHCRLTLLYPLKSAVDATTEAIVCGSRWANLEGATAATDCDVAGVTVAYQTAGSFGWVQTQGRACILSDGAPTAGDIVALSDGVTGAFHVAAGGETSLIAELIAEQIIGYCVVAGQDLAYSVIQLQME